MRRRGLRTEARFIRCGGRIVKGFVCMGGVVLGLGVMTRIGSVL